jgi:hypothetical protein
VNIDPALERLRKEQHYTNAAMLTYRLGLRFAIDTLAEVRMDTDEAQAMHERVLDMLHRSLHTGDGFANAARDEVVRDEWSQKAGTN